jgi:hypothetical protein
MKYISQLCCFVRKRFAPRIFLPVIAGTISQWNRCIRAYPEVFLHTSREENDILNLLAFILQTTRVTTRI